MKRMKLGLSLGLVAGCAVVLSAQSGTTDASKQDMKNKTVVITGCVAEDAGQYTLTHAMASGDAMAAMDRTPDRTSAGTTGSSSAASAETDNTKRGMTYDLTGGTLKPHVGHKVEVTGVKSEPSAVDKNTATATSMPSPHTDGILTVTAVKMLSATCP